MMHMNNILNLASITFLSEASWLSRAVSPACVSLWSRQLLYTSSLRKSFLHHSSLSLSQPRSCSFFLTSPKVAYARKRRRSLLQRVAWNRASVMLPSALTCTHTHSHICSLLYPRSTFLLCTRNLSHGECARRLLKNSLSFWTKKSAWR